MNPVVAARLGSDHLVAMVHPKHLPMLVEPRKWEDFDDGAYLIHQVASMRYKESMEQKTYLEKAARGGHMAPVFHGLEVLSSTPWRINRGVFDVMLAAWNGGQGIAKIPPSEENAVYALPPKPDADAEPDERVEYLMAMKKVSSLQRRDHSERCKINYNLEIARSFINDTFYLPHNMDFRGRAYPIPPHLSPVGDDLSRGLLTFAERKPLGDVRLKWLQIHLANVYGYDKMSFAERARFAQDHEADIFDSADHPLDGKKWWLQAEDPWQCLATCFELSAALRSPDPTLYESSLPIHQDGTCNGMQHYAALGGDVRGAKAVNLENADRPADIYTGVADIVNRVIEEDRKNGVPVAQLITGQLGRKVVKQTVMTTVYGVTFIGARDQIARQLLARGGIPREHLFSVSTYVAKAVLGCIGDLFRGAKDIMDWLTMSARLISRSVPAERVEATDEEVKQRAKSATSSRSLKDTSRLTREFMTSVIWTSPLGLPIVQPYRKLAKRQVMTSLQTVFIADPNQTAEVSPQRQSTAFPPNFIHSLDATHMMLTAIECKKNNITFASVHDSYWTHAATVEPMSELIRDTFIHLHSNDLIGNLREEFLERFGDHFIPVRNARNIGASAIRRRAKEDERSKQIRTALGEDLDEKAIDAVTSLTAESITEEDSPFAPAIDDVLDTENVESGSTLGPAGLIEDDLRDLVKQQQSQTTYNEEKIGRHRFVRLRDVLPPAPVRGDFDVNRIRDSAYFFS